MAEVEGQRQAVLAMYRWTYSLFSEVSSPLTSPSLRDIKEGEQLSYDYSPQLEVPLVLPLPRLLASLSLPAGAEGLPSLQLRLPGLQETPGSNCRHHWAGAVLGLPGVYCHTCTFPPIMLSYVT